MFKHHRAYLLRALDLYCAANEGAIGEVIDNYGESYPVTAESLLCCVAVYGDSFTEDLWYNTQDGQCLPADDLDGFFAFFDEAVPTLQGGDGGGPRDSIRIGKRWDMRPHHLVIVVVIVVVVLAIIIRKRR